LYTVKQSGFEMGYHLLSIGVVPFFVFPSTVQYLSENAAVRKGRLDNHQ
jgi:hypothetical protein